jgi:serine/threonine protein kinase
VFDLGAAQNWAGYELFTREVDALKTLSHPGIPRFIESFEDKAEGDSRLVLAMELMRGRDLATAMQERRFTEAEIAAILAGLADILAYLASLRPPVVHRDVNPRNVLIDDEGRVSLVDFSGAQEALRRAANPGATLIGTAGYIPIEQVSGRATIRSDLYGAAATALFLLTRHNPTELPLKNLKTGAGRRPRLLARAGRGQAGHRARDGGADPPRTGRGARPGGPRRE